MLLAVDLSNTNTKIGLYADDAGEDARPLHIWRISTNRDRTADEWWVQISTLLHAAGHGPSDLSAVAISSVVPQVLVQMRDLCERYLHLTPLVAGPGVNLGTTIQTDRPSETGADLVMNCLAAHHRYGGPAIIIGFGTATTFTCINAAGAMVGAAIAPGLALSFEALAGRAAQLYSIDLQLPERAIGTNTVESMRSGVVLGYVGLVEGLVARMAAELGGTPHVVATGFLANIIAAGTSAIGSVDDDLTLYGIYLMHRLNAPRP
ncbi:MAG: type III pantothenate kinase [Thermomicrobiales bacterium]